jgi:hypothetical protein
MALMQPDDQKQPVMEYDFLITLRSARINLFGYITQLMLFLAVAAFVLHLFDPIALYTRISYSVIIFAVVTLWLLARLRLTGRTLDYTAYKYALIVAAGGWFMAPMPLMAISFLFIAMAFLEKPVNVPQEIGFNNEGITFNSFPKRFIAWDKINNVVLKDDLLTIDYKTNKLFQREIDPGTEASVEKEFNSFCVERTRTA